MSDGSNAKVVTTDVAVIGGGPAGSTTSTLIAQQGHKVMLFERAKFPRFHIGESMIGDKFNLLDKDQELKKGACWTYWKGAYRDTGRDEGATLVLQTKSKDGWWWYIPLHDDVVSVGIVKPFDKLFEGKREHEQI